MKLRNLFLEMAFAMMFFAMTSCGGKDPVEPTPIPEPDPIPQTVTLVGTAWISDLW
jgi:predicted small lipoprotein YifL